MVDNNIWYFVKMHQAPKITPKCERTRGKTHARTHASGHRQHFSLSLNLINMNLARLCFCLSFSTKDQIVMVNGVSMENTHSNYTIQILKTCGKTANVVSTDEPPGSICVP